MAKQIDVRDLPAHVRDAMASAASAGEDVVITDGAIPQARIVSLVIKRPRIPGLNPGAMRPAADFDAPLTDEFWTGQT